MLLIFKNNTYPFLDKGREERDGFYDQMVSNVTKDIEIG